jgi:outer membrane murein-binding lipoprotein Lpp
MSKSTLKFLAVLLSVLIVAVLAAGLDNLPRQVRAQISSERAALAAAQSQLGSEKDQIARQVQAEPELFRAVTESAQWPATFAKDADVLQNASRDMAELTRLEKQNRRQDRQRVESLLAHERSLRNSAVSDAAGVQKEAAHWVEWKQHLPQAVQQMEQDYRAVHAVDLAPVAAAVQKAETDWTEKKPDLESRLAAARAITAQSESAWQGSADARRAAAAGDYAHVNLQALAGAADTLHNDAADLPKKADELRTLSGQLYNSWDKLLVDMETRGIGSDKSYDQKIRTVTTHFPDATVKNGETTSDERWMEAPRPTFDAQKNDLGMVLEHKPAGLYDFEAEHTPQPAGFAYMAPPSVGSNQYGYWEHRDGQSFWVFYGQYALMRDLLFNHSYRPPMPYEYDGYYSARRSGQTYYGKEYGTAGTATQERYSGSSYARSGGFRDSQYASKSGGYRDSRYASPMARDPNADHSPRRFGSGSRPEEPHASPPARSYRPSPRPSMPRSMPRSFGRRR